MTPTTTNTRPTDAELVAMLRKAAELILARRTRSIGEGSSVVWTMFDTADALEAASAEPRTYGDGEARYATPEAAANDSVTVWDTFDEYDYKGATRRDVIRAVLRSVGMEDQEPYTVSGVDYTFTEGC